MALSVTASNNSSTLANDLVGPGISIVPGSVSLTAATGAVGLFTGGNSVGLGIDAGVILTTGQAVTAIGPNTVTSAGTNNNAAGNSALTALIGGTATYDAADLRFNFTSNGGNLFFQF